MAQLIVELVKINEILIFWRRWFAAAESGADYAKQAISSDDLTLEKDLRMD